MLAKADVLCRPISSEETCYSLLQVVFHTDQITAEWTMGRNRSLAMSTVVGIIKNAAKTQREKQTMKKHPNEGREDTLVAHVQQIDSENEL